MKPHELTNLASSYSWSIGRQIPDMSHFTHKFFDIR